MLTADSYRRISYALYFQYDVSYFEFFSVTLIAALSADAMITPCYV